MKYSKYNIFLENHPSVGYTTVYNLFTKQCGCYLTSLLYDFVENPILPSLKEKGFVLDDAFDELARVNEWYDREIQMESKLSIMILLTGRCNCNCVYCYEKNKFNKFSSNFNSIKILEFIESYVAKSNKVDKIEIIYYGGEPLLMKNAIDEISSYLAKRYEKKFTFAIITNGTLLNSMEVLRWEKLGLKVLKITVDGNKESHNKRRRYINGEPTYDDILLNLEKMYMAQ